MQRVEQSLHRILHVLVALLMSGGVFVRVGKIGDQDVDMPDLPNEIVRHAGNRKIPIYREDLAIFLPEEFDDVGGGIRLIVRNNHYFSCKSSGHFHLPSIGRCGPAEDAEAFVHSRQDLPHSAYFCSWSATPACALTASARSVSRT